MATDIETKAARFEAGFAYRAVNVIDGVTYYSERLTNVQAEAVLNRMNVNLNRIERARTKNGMLNGEVAAFGWELV